MSIFKKFLVISVVSLIYLTVNLTSATSAVVDWSWGYTYGDSKPFIRAPLFPTDSFDVEVDITNAATSNETIYLAPFSVPQGYFYEGYYEFQSNADDIVDTPIQPGETISLNLGTWVPVGTGMPPYAYIQAQPKYLEIYYYDTNSLILNGSESIDRYSLYVYQAINTDPYDDYNPGQGLINSPMYPPINFATPVPGSLLLFWFGLMGLAGVRRSRG